LLGESEQVRPDGAEIVIVTVLLKPLTAVKVTVEFPSVPALTVRPVGLAEIPKSTTWNVIVALWTIVLLVLVTTTLLFPVVA
jgi:hypothetical protein